MLSFKEFVSEGLRERTPEQVEKIIHRISKDRKPYMEKKDMHNLLPIVPYSGFHKDNFYITQHTFSIHGKIKQIDPKTLVTNQDTISKPVVLAKLHGTWEQKHDPEIPHVVQYGNLHIMYDGNHRGSVERGRNRPLHGLTVQADRLPPEKHERFRQALPKRLRHLID